MSGFPGKIWMWVSPGNDHVAGGQHYNLRLLCPLCSSLTSLLLFAIPGHMYLFIELQNHLPSMALAFSRVNELTEGKPFMVTHSQFLLYHLEVSHCMQHRLRDEFQGTPEYCLNPPLFGPW